MKNLSIVRTTIPIATTLLDVEMSLSTQIIKEETIARKGTQLLGKGGNLGMMRRVIPIGMAPNKGETMRRKDL